MSNKLNQFSEENNKGWGKKILIRVIKLKPPTTIFPLAKNTHKTQSAKIPLWAQDLWRWKAWVWYQESVPFLQGQPINVEK